MSSGQKTEKEVWTSVRKEPYLSVRLKWNLGQNPKAYVFSNTRTNKQHTQKQERKHPYGLFAARLVSFSWIRNKPRLCTQPLFCP